MTERKPPFLSFESWVDRQIREAEARGEFDNLPGAGKPIEGLDKPHDELWWVKQKLARENISVEPEALRLRRDVEKALGKILELPSERAVRKMVDELNEKIREVNATVTSGPASNVVPLDPERIVTRWRESK